MNLTTRNVILAVIGVILGLLLADKVLATKPADPGSDPKVFVCKYVGTPGDDERLQTGQNPISVSTNAIKDYQGVGSYFNDKHGRSYVLEEDTGQDEPSVDKCPKPLDVPEEEPPKEEKPPVEETPEAPVQTESTNLK